VKYLLLTICLFTFGLVAVAQSPVSVEEIYFAKDDGTGEMGDVVESFQTTDTPIYVVVKLTDSAVMNVKMNLVAASVKGLKADSNIITTSFKTSKMQNRVNFSGKPEKLWFVGKYRVDIFLDDKFSKSLEFEITEPIKNSAAINSFAPQTATKSKPKPATKIKKKVLQ
jgi:hypothetical protein